MLTPSGLTEPASWALVALVDWMDVVLTARSVVNVAGVVVPKTCAPAVVDDGLAAAMAAQ